MEPRLEFSIKPSAFDRTRQLILDPEYIEFDDKNLASSPATKFVKGEMQGLRYGVKGIGGVYFNFGRIYSIDIRSNTNEIIKIRLVSHYGLKKKEFGKKYAEIVNTLYKYYFHDISRYYISLFTNDEVFEISGVEFSPEGVLFREKAGIIPWDYLGTKSYHGYYMLFSETDPDQYKAFEYINDWNAGVLKGITEYIIKLKFPKRKV